jgi:hypothetical protein
MSHRGNDYDVSARFNTTDPQVVNDEIDRIYLALYPVAPTRLLDQAFRDVTRLYRGERPGYHRATPPSQPAACLEVTLAMARLIDGCERARTGAQARAAVPAGRDHGPVPRCRLRAQLKDHTHANGAEYPITFRGVFKDYLPQIGMAKTAYVAAALIHFTGYEMPLAKIRCPRRSTDCWATLGSADIIAQMADRCYLEKCAKPVSEFVAGGLAIKRTPEAKQVVFVSGENLVIKTPDFSAS